MFPAYSTPSRNHNESQTTRLSAMLGKLRLPNLRLPRAKPIVNYSRQRKSISSSTLSSWTPIPLKWALYQNLAAPSARSCPQRSLLSNSRLNSLKRNSQASGRSLPPQATDLKNWKHRWKVWTSRSAEQKRQEKNFPLPNKNPSAFRQKLPNWRKKIQYWRSGRLQHLMMTPIQTTKPNVCSVPNLQTRFKCSRLPMRRCYKLVTRR